MQASSDCGEFGVCRGRLCLWLVHTWAELRGVEGGAAGLRPQNVLAKVATPVCVCCREVKVSEMLSLGHTHDHISVITAPVAQPIITPRYHTPVSTPCEHTL